MCSIGARRGRADQKKKVCVCVCGDQGGRGMGAEHLNEKTKKKIFSIFIIHSLFYLLVRIHVAFSSSKCHHSQE